MATEQGGEPVTAQDEHLAALELVKRSTYNQTLRQSPAHRHLAADFGPEVGFPNGTTSDEAAVAFKIGTGFGESGCWHYKRRRENVEKLRQKYTFPALKRSDGEPAVPVKQPEPPVPFEVVPGVLWTIANKRMELDKAVLILLGYRIPKGAEIVPTCGNDWCCNPDHREAFLKGERIDLDRRWRLIRLPDGDWWLVHCLEGKRAGRAGRAAG